MSEQVKHYIFAGTGKPNQIGILEHDGPIEDPDGQPVYVSAEDYAKLQAERNRYRQALEALDKWQGAIACNASVYELTDYDFSHMQSIVHEALK